MATLTNQLMEQREQNDACIDSAESRQKKAEGQQIEQKMQQLKQLTDKAQQLKNELVEAGAWPLNENDLENVAGGLQKRMDSSTVDPKIPKGLFDGPDFQREPEYQ